MVDSKTCGQTFWRYRNFFFIVLPPFLALPLPFLVEGQESKCGYVMLLMAIYWCTEAMPLSVTAMLPLFVMPLLGLLKSEDTVPLYMAESTMMFCGGLMVALAIERCNLHTRIALSILRIVGVKPIWLMVGFIAPTWFLSMWISNTATTSMMLPILEAVLEKLGQIGRGEISNEDEEESGGIDNIGMDKLSEDQHKDTNKVVYNEVDEVTSFGADTSDVTIKYKPSNGLVNGTTNIVNSTTEALEDSQDNEDDDDDVKPIDEKYYRNLCKGMTLAVAYSANIGGTGTLTGTTPNIILRDFAEQLWRDNGFTESPVNFASYMVFCTPTALITIIFVWLWLALFYLGPRGFKCCGNISNDQAKQEALIKSEIKKDYVALGKMKYDEYFVLVIFMAMVLMWFFRSPGFMDGWGDTHYPGFNKDSVASLMCVVACFIFPSQRPRWGSQKKNGPVDTLLDWDTIQHKFPWGVIFLVGGGMALAEAATNSGLSDAIGNALTVLDALPLWFMAFVLALITSFMTEITSNTATCTLILPIVSKMAENMKINPLYLMFPCAVSTSYAFMLPVSTPPNAIAFSYNRVSVLDMVKAGVVLKLTIFVITLATETWGMAYFDFATLPWDPSNSTNITDAHYQLLKDIVHTRLTGLD